MNRQKHLETILVLVLALLVFYWLKHDKMGWVMSKVILTVVFFVFLFPMAMAKKFFGKPSVQMKAGGNSYYKERNFVYTKESLENVW